MVIPAQKVKGEDAQGNTIISYLASLNYFKNNDESMDSSIADRVSLKTFQHITSTPKPKRSKLSSLVLNDENDRDLSAIYNGNQIDTEDLNVPGIDFHVENTSLGPLEATYMRKVRKIKKILFRLYQLI